MTALHFLLVLLLVSVCLVAVLAWLDQRRGFSRDHGPYMTAAGVVAVAMVILALFFLFVNLALYLFRAGVA